MNTQVEPHSFRPLRPWDMRRGGRCRHCYAPMFAHPMHCWVRARPMGDKSKAELSFDALTALDSTQAHGEAAPSPDALFDAARELHRDLAKLWIGGGFPQGVYDSWRGLGAALQKSSPLAALDPTQTHGGSDA